MSPCKEGLQQTDTELEISNTRMDCCKINCCKRHFTKTFKQPWESITVALVKRGFEKCGISPVNRNTIEMSGLSGETVSIENKRQQSQMNQTPVFVPDKQPGPSLHQLT